MDYVVGLNVPRFGTFIAFAVKTFLQCHSVYVPLVIVNCVKQRNPRSLRSVSVDLFIYITTFVIIVVRLLNLAG